MKIALGILSEVNGKHTPLFDFDFKNEKKAVAECERLMGKFELSDCVLFSTKKGFHAVFFWNRVSFDNYAKMLEDSKLCDKRFLKIVKLLKKANLRLKGKHYADKKTKCIIVSPFSSTKNDVIVGNAVFTLTKKMIK